MVRKSEKDVQNTKMKESWEGENITNRKWKMNILKGIGKKNGYF